MRVLTPGESRALGILSTGLGSTFGLFEVTSTQLAKSIIDAHEGIRQSFEKTGFHDYSQQLQGQTAKVVRAARVISATGVHSTTISLYRPETKLGDPRFWIAGLPRLAPEAAPGHILAVVQDGNACVVVDLTRLAESGTGLHAEDPPESGFARLVRDTLANAFGTGPAETNPWAAELLERLRVLAASGLIFTEKSGPTAVGHAVETALGIQQNSSKDPDYHGIELKSHRRNAKNRVTLFAQVPDWSLSVAKSSAAILDKCGYEDSKGTRALQCSISAVKPNTQGLQFHVDFECARVEEVRVMNGETESIATWTLAKLESRLGEKHAETFWIEAEEVEQATKRAFALKSVLHTTTPDMAKFATMIANGGIQMDHLIRDRPGKGVTEKGPLFKIWPADLPALFTVEGEYRLV